MVTFEAVQLTVNDPHCVVAEYEGVNATVVTRDEKRARQLKNKRLELGARKASMSHGNTGDERTPESQLWAAVEKARRGAVWKPERAGTRAARPSQRESVNSIFQLERGLSTTNQS